MLRAVNRAHEQQRDLSNAAWMGNFVVENALPALGIVLTSSSSIDPAYRPLAHPSVLVFFLFIILSTLRLNPALCRLSGFVAAVSYLAAALFLGWKPSFAGGTSLLSPQKAVFGFALEFVIGGVFSGVGVRGNRQAVGATFSGAQQDRPMD